jgi:hypothetical protein
MLMGPRLRKLSLTVHVVSSVAWIGAVAAFLALAVAGLTSADAGLVRAAYVAMNLVTSWVIVPLSVAALLMGIVHAIATPWGLFQHYWVLFKLLLTVLATAVLLVHTRPIAFMAHAAGVDPLNPSVLSEFQSIKVQLVVDAAAGIAVLLVATVLALYKPRGLTPWAGRGLADPPR